MESWYFSNCLQTHTVHICGETTLWRFWRPGNTLRGPWTSPDKSDTFLRNVWNHLPSSNDAASHASSENVDESQGPCSHSEPPVPW